MPKVFKLIIAVLVSELAGIIGAFFTAPAISTWYAALAKPALNPPAWVFGPVWTTLYLLMGIAAWLVWEKANAAALKIFLVQLALNTLWSVIFFGLHRPQLGVRRYRPPVARYRLDDDRIL